MFSARKSEDGTTTEQAGAELVRISIIQDVQAGFGEHAGQGN